MAGAARSAEEREEIRVRMEVLAGARGERNLDALRRPLARGTPITTESTDDDAAALYRVCRRNGASVRKMIDCLISSIAIRSGSTVLHADSGLDVLAQHTPLELDQLGS